MVARIKIVSYCGWSTTTVTQPRMDHQRRDPPAGTHRVGRAALAALARRGDVIPLAAELVVGDDHHRVGGAAAALDRPEQLHEVGAAGVALA